MEFNAPPPSIHSGAGAPGPAWYGRLGAADDGQFGGPFGAQPDGGAFRRFLATALRHRGTLLLTFLVPFLVAVGLALVPRTTYEAEARLLVLIGSEYVFRPEIGTAGAGMALDPESIVKSEVEILRSWSLKERILRRMGVKAVFPDLYEEDRPIDPMMPRSTPAGTAPGVSDTDDREPAPTDENRWLQPAIVAFAKRLTVEPMKDSSVIRVSFRHADRQVAADVVNELVAAYFERRTEILHRSRAPGLAASYAHAEQAVAAKRQQLDGFKQRHDIVDLGREVALVLERQSHNETALAAARGDLEEANQRLAQLRRTLAATPPRMVLHSDALLLESFQRSTEELTRLEAQRASLASTLLDTHPSIVAIDRQIASLRARLGGAPATRTVNRQGPNPLYVETEGRVAETEAAIAGLTAAISALTAEGAQLRRQASALRALQVEYEGMERGIRILEGAQETLARNLGEAEAFDHVSAQKSDNVRLIQAALPPVEGRSLAVLIVAVGGILGALATVFTAFLLEAMRSVYVTAQDAAQSLGLPVLASIPAVPRRPTRPPARRLRSDRGERPQVPGPGPADRLHPSPQGGA